jgi:hypothetical protein
MILRLDGISPDDKWFAATPIRDTPFVGDQARESLRPRVWNIETGQFFVSASSLPAMVAFTRDSRKVLSVTAKGAAEVFDLTSYRLAFLPLFIGRNERNWSEPADFAWNLSGANEFGCFSPTAEFRCILGILVEDWPKFGGSLILEPMKCAGSVPVILKSSPIRANRLPINSPQVGKPNIIYPRITIQLGTSHKSLILVSGPVHLKGPVGGFSWVATNPQMHTTAS